MEIPPTLRSGLERAIEGIPTATLAEIVTGLIDRYRAGERVVTDRWEAAAYAVYRMPATFAAMTAALRAALPHLGTLPRSAVDIGGGTGASTWAALTVFPSVEETTVLDASAEALDLGTSLGPPGAVTWRRATLPAALPGPVDLALLGYVLSEMDDPAPVLAGAAANAGLVAVVEPGTPAGFRRVLAARRALLEAGLEVVAPCPQQGHCPWAESDDWCHFAARFPRSRLHRRLKGGEHGYEDEPFSYVVAARTVSGRAPGRIVRHPRIRPGVIDLTVCTADAEVMVFPVSRRDQSRYRAARHAGWGSEWEVSPA